MAHGLVEATRYLSDRLTSGVHDRHRRAAVIGLARKVVVRVAERAEGAPAAAAPIALVRAALGGRAAEGSCAGTCPALRLGALDRGGHSRGGGGLVVERLRDPLRAASPAASGGACEHGDQRAAREEETRVTTHRAEGIASRGATDERIRKEGHRPRRTRVTLIDPSAVVLRTYARDVATRFEPDPQLRAQAPSASRKPSAHVTAFERCTEASSFA